jgi:hypothetical protein
VKSGKRLFVIYSTHYVDKEILYQRNNDSDHISKEVLKCLDGEVKT